LYKGKTEEKKEKWGELVELEVKIGRVAQGN